MFNQIQAAEPCRRFTQRMEELSQVSIEEISSITSDLKSSIADFAAPGYHLMHEMMGKVKIIYGNLSQLKRNIEEAESRINQHIEGVTISRKTLAGRVSSFGFVGGVSQLVEYSAWGTAGVGVAALQLGMLGFSPPVLLISVVGLGLTAATSKATKETLVSEKKTLEEYVPADLDQITAEDPLELPEIADTDYTKESQFADRLWKQVQMRPIVLNFRRLIEITKQADIQKAQYKKIQSAADQALAKLKEELARVNQLVQQSSPGEITAKASNNLKDPPFEMGDMLPRKKRPAESEEDLKRDHQESKPPKAKKQKTSRSRGTNASQ